MPTGHKSRFIAIAAAAFLAGALPVVAQDELTLTLALAGEAYNGDPAFAVFFNGRQIGTSGVSSAIDTQADGRLAAAEDYADHVDTFDFRIPADAYSSDGTIEIRFTNDAAGEGGDRNLFVLSATLAGETVPYDAFVVEREGVVGNTVVSGRPMIALYKNSDVAFAMAPEKGWGAMAASAAADTVDTATTEETAEVSDAMTVDEDMACPPVPDVALAGFARNSAALTNAHRDALNALLADVDPEGCALELTGYSSTSGPDEWNASLAAMRADAVRRYIEGQAAAFAGITVEAGGETDRFGPQDEDNQRVVVTIAAPAG